MPYVCRSPAPGSTETDGVITARCADSTSPAPFRFRLNLRELLFIPLRALSNPRPSSSSSSRKMDREDLKAMVNGICIRRVSTAMRVYFDGDFGRREIGEFTFLARTSLQEWSVRFCENNFTRLLYFRRNNVRLYSSSHRATASLQSRLHFCIFFFF